MNQPIDHPIADPASYAGVLAPNIDADPANADWPKPLDAAAPLLRHGVHITTQQRLHRSNAMHLTDELLADELEAMAGFAKGLRDKEALREAALRIRGIRQRVESGELGLGALIADHTIREDNPTS